MKIKELGGIILGWLGYRKYTYEGASKGRRFADLKAPSSTAKTEAEKSGKTLRDRARYYSRNGGWGKRVREQLCGLLIGTGAQIKFVGAPNIGDVWKEWAKHSCADGQSWEVMQTRVIRTLVESGEAFIRVVFADDVRFQVLEPEFVEKIEYGEFGEPVRYFVFPKHPSDEFCISIPVDASEIIHVFDEERVYMGRGVPWLSPILLDLKDLHEWDDAEMMRSKLSTFFAAFVRKVGSQMGFAGGKEQASSSGFDKLEAGGIIHLGPGEDVTLTEPPPNSGYEGFLRAKLRKIAVSVGLTYEALSGDYSNVNFSSARMAALDSRRQIDTWRWMMLVPKFYDRVLEVWKLFSLGATKNLVHEWTLPAYNMLDPMKETEADVLAIEAKIKSRAQVIRERGDDPELVFAEIRAEKEFQEQPTPKLDLKKAAA